MRLLAQCLLITVVWVIISAAAGLLVARVFMLNKDTDSEDRDAR